MEQHAEVLIGSPWRQRIPTWRDVVAMLPVLAIVILFGSGAHHRRPAVLRRFKIPALVTHQ